MGGNEIKFIHQAFESNYIAPVGPQLNEFEKEFSEYLNIKAVLAVTSGTAAIHLALKFLGVGSGDIVFCSSLTFIGSANPILYLGAEPVFIDSEPESWNMSPLALEKAFLDFEKKGIIPKAVIIVNLYGQNADMDTLIPICEKYNVPVVEDAAESLGATYNHKASGTFGKFGIFSFNGNKIITTSGGGMLVSNDVEAIEKARYWSTQARDPFTHYQHSEIGYNYRMSNILAAIGRGQLLVLDSHVEKCRAIFQRYSKNLSHIDGFEFMPELPKSRSNRWLTALTVDTEKCGISPMDIVNYLEEKNIESRPVWKPLHLQPLFKKNIYYSHNEQSVSDYLFYNGICLPSGSNLTEEEQDYIIDKIFEIKRLKNQ